MKKILWLIITATMFAFGIVVGLNLSSGRDMESAKKIAEYYKESLSCRITLKGCEVTCGAVSEELIETRYMVNRCNALLTYVCDLHGDTCERGVKELTGQ
jgi:hypothetical protein